MKKEQFTKKFHNFGDGNVSYIEWNYDKGLPGFQFSHATGFNSLTYRKLLDLSLAKKYGWKHNTSLEQGLSNTINDYLSKYLKKSR